MPGRVLHRSRGSTARHVPSPSRFKEHIFVSDSPIILYFGGELNHFGLRDSMSAYYQAPAERETHRKRHKLGDEQIGSGIGQRGMKDLNDDMNFTPQSLAKNTAATLIVYGHRDPIYDVQMAVEMYRATPGFALWVVPTADIGRCSSRLRSGLLKFFRGE